MISDCQGGNSLPLIKYESFLIIVFLSWEKPATFAISCDIFYWQSFHQSPHQPPCGLNMTLYPLGGGGGWNKANNDLDLTLRDAKSYNSTVEYPLPAYELRRQGEWKLSISTPSYWPGFTLPLLLPQLLINSPWMVLISISIVCNKLKEQNRNNFSWGKNTTQTFWEFDEMVAKLCQKFN